MASLSASDMRFLDTALMMTGGYCLDFSDRTYSEFFADVLNYNIDEEHNFAEGGSKGKRMRYFLRSADDRTVARLLRALWEYREDMTPSPYGDPDPPTMKPRFMGIVEKLEGSAGTARTDALEKFTADETLEELIAAIHGTWTPARPGPRWTGYTPTA